MGRFLDRTGLRYGRLVVTEYKGKDHRYKHLWLCKCDCGNEKIVVSDNLSSGKSNSCGCLRIDTLNSSGQQFVPNKDREVILLNRQYHSIKKRSKHLGFKEVINFDVFRKIVKSPCVYCGLEYSKEIVDKNNKKVKPPHILKCNGIDRVDSSLGYMEENSVSCCKYCNFAKHTMSRDDFLKWVKKVYEYNFKN